MDAPSGRLMSRRALGRRNAWRGPEQTEPAGVLLATLRGRPFSRASLSLARQLAGGQQIAVLSISRIYGTALGLQNPGLFPTRQEREEQLRIVNDALEMLSRGGGKADGQVSTTRHAEKAIAYVAKRRGVHAVVLDVQERRWLRRVVEGDPARAVRRRVGPGADVREVVNPRSAR